MWDNKLILKTHKERETYTQARPHLSVANNKMKMQAAITPYCYFCHNLDSLKKYA